VGGSFARTNLPAAQSGNAHNANNALTTKDAATLTYDHNGNLLSDGTNTYTWNSRDQLASIAGPVAASFQYDAFGRRKLKTVAGITNKYVYDGANIVQELTGTNSVTAVNLTGLGMDELFARTEGATVKTIMADALGSTIAVADSVGIQTSWTYEPYGKATYTGSAQTNPQLYTGRELDGTGFYYYRARYYHPALQRFISEDPIEYAGGGEYLCLCRGRPDQFCRSDGTLVGRRRGVQGTRWGNNIWSRRGY
jgi:RHS repeat-associated protein